ncbi:site-specific integrase [Marinomonas pollencensis]|uniref:Site-specific recombinase XerD n=1 Tax=Marinomonas pollencensis TaxID=491954 RepID=A0A3E0DV08_9GAMM|nr:tyrosine-type recombinase/integrase [Marinomonas pollencensis]REG86738.1 site-specific recombinase XerD [Marinomonas pollencensis]
MASIFKTDDGTWCAQVSVKGKRKTKRGFSTKREAQAWASDLEREAKESTSSDIPDRPFSKALERYRDTVSVTKRGQKFEIRRIERWLGKSADEPADPLCFISLQDIQSKHFAEWRDRRLQKVAVGTVLREWTVLSSICSQCAKEWGWLKENPMTRVKRPKEPDARTRRLLPGEFEQLMIATQYDIEIPPESKSERIGAAIVFAIETAMRAGEICGITWEDVNLERRTVHLAKTKNGNPRTVPLSTTAVKVLEKLKTLDDCKRNAFNLKSDSLDVNFRKIRNKCLIDDLHFHDLRREALTRLATKVDVLNLAKISGHTDLRILQRVYYAPDMGDIALMLD